MFQSVRESVLNSLPTILAKFSLQRYSTVRCSVDVDAQVSSNFDILIRHQQVVREDTAGDLLAVLAMTEAGDHFFGGGFDGDGYGAAEAVAGQGHDV